MRTRVDGLRDGIGSSANDARGSTINRSVRLTRPRTGRRGLTSPLAVVLFAYLCFASGYGRLTGTVEVVAVEYENLALSTSTTPLVARTVVFAYRVPSSLLLSESSSLPARPRAPPY